jgi:integrase/recombinase XerD
MKALSQHLTDYLTLRRQLGFKFYVEGSFLHSFVRFASQQKARFVSARLALEWSTLPAGITQKHRAVRLGVVRGFARYLKLFDRRTEVPSAKMLPARTCRPSPFLYTEKQVDQLIYSAHQIDPRYKIKGLTLGTLLGLLATTGMRVSEALALDRDDVDVAGALLTIRWAKGNKSRLVPLHASTLQALGRYACARDKIYPRSTTPGFFVWVEGRRLRYQVAWEWFRVAACNAGLRALGGGRGSPRIHDLRHYFAVRTLLNWYRSDADVDVHLPELATFLGHAHVTDTYWYISAVPELLALATHRWERAEKGRK